MKDVLNSRIKRREAFRPFAPSIFKERVRDYLENSYPDPFMIKVYSIKPSRRSGIPAVPSSTARDVCRRSRRG